jgi:cell division cycle 2-like protein
LLCAFFCLTVLTFFCPLRYNRLRDKFPAASFSGRPILSEAGFDLLNSLLTYDPDKVKFVISNWHLLMCCILIMHTCLSALVSLIQRISADDALDHKWFSEVPLPKSKDFMPTFPALNELDR